MSAASTACYLAYLNRWGSATRGLTTVKQYLKIHCQNNRSIINSGFIQDYAVFFLQKLKSNLISSWRNDKVFSLSCKFPRAEHWVLKCRNLMETSVQSHSYNPWWCHHFMSCAVLGRAREIKNRKTEELLSSRVSYHLPTDSLTERESDDVNHN